MGLFSGIKKLAKKVLGFVSPLQNPQGCLEQPHR